MSQQNRFDQLIQQMDGDGIPYRGPLIDVGDTCYAGLLWFKSHEITPTAADLLEWTRLVFEKEREQ